MASLSRCASILLLLSQITVAADRKCPFINTLTEDEHCIEATGGDSASFEFKPLFPENPTFVHAFETASSDDLKDYPSLHSETGLFVKVGFWLEYGKADLDESANRLTDFAAVYFNTSNDVGGGNNGCDGAFGKSCMTALKRELKSKVPSGIKKLDEQALLPAPFLESALGAAEVDDECPEQLLQAWRPEVGYLESNLVATELKDKTEIFPSGNSSYIWLRELVGDLESPYGKVAMGILARAPADKNGKADDVQVEFVCVKTAKGSNIPESPSDDSGSGSGSDSDPGSDSSGAMIVSTYFGLFISLVVGLLVM